jgi:hypothetical protein
MFDNDGRVEPKLSIDYLFLGTCGSALGRATVSEPAAICLFGAAAAIALIRR